jgi:hypothetical protein
MSSDLPLEISRANSSAVKGKSLPWECRTGLPKKCLNQTVSRLMCGISRPQSKTRSSRKVPMIARNLQCDFDFAPQRFAIPHVRARLCCTAVRYDAVSVSPIPQSAAIFAGDVWKSGQTSSSSGNSEPRLPPQVCCSSACRSIRAASLFGPVAERGIEAFITAGMNAWVLLIEINR